MKKKYYIITAVASYLILLIATIPAKLVTDIINDKTPVSLQGVSGTLWQGKIYRITLDNAIQLSDTEWSATPWKLLTGRIAIEASSRFDQQDINAEIGSSFLGRYFVNGLQAKVSARKVAELANIPLAKLSGMIAIDIDHAEWKQGELPLATGSVRWNDATVTVADTASLGNISILLSETDQQLLMADISNQGGDIKIDGTAELVPAADYSVNVKLKPTASANNNIKQSLGLFAKKSNNGEYLLKYSGPLNQIGI